MTTCEDARQVMDDALNGVMATDDARRGFNEHVSSCVVCLPWLRRIEDALAGRYRPEWMRGDDAGDADGVHLHAVPAETPDAPSA